MQTRKRREREREMMLTYKGMIVHGEGQMKKLDGDAQDAVDQPVKRTKTVKRSNSWASTLSRSMSKKVPRALSFQQGNSSELLRQLDNSERPSGSFQRAGSARSIGAALGRTLERRLSAASLTLRSSLAESGSAISQRLKRTKSSKETLASPMEWKMSTQLFPYLVKNFQMFREVDLNIDGKRFVQVSETVSCSLSVVEVQTKDEFFYVTAGLANLTLLRQALRGISLPKRSPGHELVFSLKKDRDARALGHRAKHPAWPRKLLLQLLGRAAKNDMSELRSFGLLAVEKSEDIPEPLLAVALCHADFANAESLWQSINDLHGRISFLMLVALDQREAQQVDNHAVFEYLCEKREREGRNFACNPSLV